MYLTQQTFGEGIGSNLDRMYVLVIGKDRFGGTSSPRKVIHNEEKLYQIHTFIIVYIENESQMAI